MPSRTKSAFEKGWLCWREQILRSTRVGAIQHSYDPICPGLFACPEDRIIAVSMDTPSIIAKWDKRAFGDKTPPDILAHDYIATAGVIFASVATPTCQFVGNPFNQNRIATRGAGSIDIGAQNGPVCHGNGNLAFNMNLIASGRDILRLHWFLRFLTSRRARLSGFLLGHQSPRLSYFVHTQRSTPGGV